jgi:hypothetical protein
VTQLPGTDYTWTSGTNITFTTPPPNGVSVLVRYMQGLPFGTADSADVAYLPSGTGAVATNVQSKLRESVSVFDFMTAAQIAAVQAGTSVDDTAAIQAAVTAGRSVFIPPGSYKITASITVPNNREIHGVWGSTAIRAYGVDAFVIAAGGAFVSIDSLIIASYSADGATADPRLYAAVSCNGTSLSSVNNCSFSNLYLQGWADGINWEYTWTSRIRNVSTVNTNNGVVLFGQSVNNSISDSSLVCNGGNASVHIVKDVTIIGEGLMISNTLLASGAYGVRAAGGFLSLSIIGCVIDLISNTGLSLTNVQSLHCIGNWIYATNKGIEYAPLGVNVDVNGAISNNTIIVTTTTLGRGIDIGGANKGITVTGGTIKVSGTSQGIYVQGQDCYFGGIHFDNPGTGFSIFLNITLGNKIGACTGDATTFGGFQNDYSTGTWVPVISADGLGVTTFTATTASGSYTKIGRQVTVICEYEYSSIGSVGGAYGFMTGLPFARVADGIEPITFCAINGTAFNTNTYQALFISPTVIAFQYNNGQGTLYGGAPYMLGNSFPASGTVRFVMTYFADA